MARKIPPFAAIRAFEAAGRYGNLRQASEELFLSISAVSHQVKSLEQFLGVRLFNRVNNSLELTSAGENYRRDLATALDLIASATARTEAARDTTSISINLFPSLAVLWLMPQLSRFYRDAPEIEVNFITSMDPLSFRSAQIDLAIRYEDKEHLPDGTQILFEETMYPVLAPGHTLAENGSFDNATVIQCQTTPTEWDDWFRSMEGTSLKPFRILSVNNRALALQAAVSGLGVAMGRTPFVENLLAEGRLQRLADTTLKTGKVYTLHFSHGAYRSPAVRKFVSWLMDEARAI